MRKESWANRQDGKRGDLSPLLPFVCQFQVRHICPIFLGTESAGLNQTLAETDEKHPIKTGCSAMSFASFMGYFSSAPIAFISRVTRLRFTSSEKAIIGWFIVGLQSALAGMPDKRFGIR
jgi:hypothetical protein